MLATDVPVKLTGVVGGEDLEYLRPESKIGKGWIRDVVVAGKCWIDATIEEQLVLFDSATHISAEIEGSLVLPIVALGHQQRIGIGTRGFELLRREITVHRTVQFIGAGLGDDVDHPAERLPVLSFEPARLHLDFLNEVEVDTVT